MISEYVGIDPGTRCLGWVRGQDGRIVAAGLSRAPEDVKGCAALAEYHASQIGRGSASVAVVESMVWDGRRPTTAQDLIDVQTVGCLTASRVASQVVLRRPADWKSNISKEYHHPRILDALDPAERRIVEAAAKAAGRNAKEVLDASGILLQYLKRIDKDGGRYRA